MEAVMILENPLKRTLKAGGVVLGTMLTHLRQPAVAVLMKNAGWDYVFLDAEHGSFTPPSLMDFCIAARGVNLPTIVRVPSSGEAQRLYQTLDLGATGLLCPQTETRAQVEFIIHSTKYFPMGQRGMSLRNVHTFWGKYKGSDLTPKLNQETMIVLQIESKKGVDNLEAMLDVPGVDAVFIGPNDMSQTLGIPGDIGHPEVAKHVDRVLEVCQKKNIPCGVHTYDIDTAKKWIGRGCRFMCLGGDMAWLQDSCQKACAEVKEALPRQ
jgi:2-keto-3-deoxy-L-rhamnonate aldolase RhmA